MPLCHPLCISHVCFQQTPHSFQVRAAATSMLDYSLFFSATFTGLEWDIHVLYLCDHLQLCHPLLFRRWIHLIMWFFFAFHSSCYSQIAVKCQYSPFSSMLPTKLSSAKFKMSFLRSGTWLEGDLCGWYMTWIWQAMGFWLLQQENPNTSTILLPFTQPIAGVKSDPSFTSRNGARGVTKPLLVYRAMQPFLVVLCPRGALRVCARWLPPLPASGGSLKSCCLSCHRRSTPPEQCPCWQSWGQRQPKITYM